MAPDNPNRFAGELLDGETGLYDLRARMYDPAVGRFLSLDPRPAGAASPYEASYVYALNSPAAWIDPSGLGAVWSDGLSQGSRVIDRIAELLKKLRNGFCAGSKLIPLAAAAIANPVLFAYWLIGFMTVCTKHVQRAVGALASIAETIANNWRTVGSVVGACGFVAYFGHGAVSTAVGAASLKYLGRSILLSTPTASAIACGLGGASALLGIRNPLRP
jgi:RHS repeat-associated protein